MLPLMLQEWCACVPFPAVLVYILLCVVMLVLQPQMSIESVGMSQQLHSLEEGREGRGRRVGRQEGEGEGRWEGRVGRGGDGGCGGEEGMG